ncbi:MAG: phage antirepressor N-terminal domain-containing protein [Chloroflexaceae bacterium]
MTDLPLTPHTVTFYGDEILAVQEPEKNHIYVPMARMCENLGVDRPSQIERIQEHEVLKSGLKTFKLQTAGGVQETQCLRLDLIPFWLAGLNVNRVKKSVRDNLLLYQRECAAVLWDVFRPAGQPSSAALATDGERSPAAQAYEMAIAIAAIARQQMHMEERMSDVAAAVTDQAQRIEALELKLTPQGAITEAQATELSQAVKTVARALGDKTGRNEYGGVYGQLYREFDITSYKHLPVDQFEQAMEWLRDWYRRIKQEGAEPQP